jgi:hypothetical protein
VYVWGHLWFSSGVLEVCLSLSISLPLVSLPIGVFALTALLKLNRP